jgi:hypothetical protein
VPTACQVGSVTVLPKKNKKRNKPMILCVHSIGFSSQLPINQSINQFEERNKWNYKEDRVDRIDQISLTKFTSFLFI